MNSVQTTGGGGGGGGYRNDGKARNGGGLDLWEVGFLLLYVLFVDREGKNWQLFNVHYYNRGVSVCSKGDFHGIKYGVLVVLPYLLYLYVRTVVFAFGL